MPYLYRHIRLDKNEPFYIGIGSDSDYRRANNIDRNVIWKSITSKTEYIVEIILDDISWEIACEKEKEFIKLYGRKDLKTGSLCNMTDGGEGTLNKVYTEEYRKKLSEASKKQIRTAETKLKVGNKLRGRKRGKYNYTEESKNSLIEYSKNRFFSEETRKKLSIKNTKFGKDNSQFGRCWIYNESLRESKSIRGEDLTNWLNIGWTKGRRMFK